VDETPCPTSLVEKSAGKVDPKLCTASLSIFLLAFAKHQTNAQGLIFTFLKQIWFPDAAAKRLPAIA